ncbi:MAG TPA: class I SAM-dependent methyltransferase [Longimicrobiales bacterium]|nr:class I SAM-dependent methyltransferase [Longimicrobiales bacterium]
MSSTLDELFATTARRDGSPEPPPRLAVRMPDGQMRVYGDGDPAAVVVVRDARGVAALLSRDEVTVGEAYMDGSLEVEGEFLAVLALRGSLRDRHPLWRLLRFVRPLLRGQVSADREVVPEHYEREEDFWLAFLDRRHRCYSHGLFEHDQESLEDAMTRKLQAALSAVNAQPGDRLLDIGGGWGAMTEFAGKRGVRVTSLTIAEESRKYLEHLIAREDLPCEVLMEHFFEHRPREPYDGIVNLGVTEHLPDYERTLRHYDALLKPGGKVYLDASASRAKYDVDTFTQKYIYRGNGRFLCLHEYLEEVAKSPFEPESVVNDRASYALTATRWAENLEASRDEIERRWGGRLFRLFRLYLWNTARSFGRGHKQAYRVVLRRTDDR